MKEIIVKNIYKSYGNIKVFEDFSLTFEYGQRYCIIGPSGQGKTTLLHLLMGLITPDHGEILGLEGLEISPVFQEDRLCENLSVYRNIRLVEKERISTVELNIALQAVGMEDWLYQPAKTLSGGMKQRVSVLRAMLHGGDVFLMDEPFKGLDQQTKKETIAYVKDKTQNKTVVWVTHTTEDIKYLPSHIIDLSKNIIKNV